MASSRTEPTPPTTTPSPVAFALQELIACWDQGYEALARGDLDRVTSLLDIADDHLANIGRPADDTPELAHLRNAAVSAKGRLEHGMRGGLAGLQEEMARTRQGAKVLKGYGQARATLGTTIHRSI
jgi:hypothetical protein